MYQLNEFTSLRKRHLKSTLISNTIFPMYDYSLIVPYPFSADKASIIIHMLIGQLDYIIICQNI